MAFEGVFTFVMLSIGGVPFAALLGLLTGLLAFIPNIGAIIAGILMVAVGFSAGSGEGLWAIFVYFFVQNVDGYLVVPYIARRTVTLPQQWFLPRTAVRRTVRRAWAAACRSHRCDHQGALQSSAGWRRCGQPAREASQRRASGDLEEKALGLIYLLGGAHGRAAPARPALMDVDSGSF